MSNKINSFANPAIGPKFLHIDNGDLQSAFTAAITSANVGAIETAFLPNRTGTGLMLSARLTDMSFKHEDSVYTPTVWIKNHNDGGTALSSGIGLFRFICMNGLYFGVSVFAGRLIHRVGENATDFLNQLPLMLQNGVYQVQNGALEDTITESAQVKVLDPIDVIASLPQLTPRQRETAITLAANPEALRTGDRVSDAWGLYNVINETIRKRSRSAIASANRDIGLLDDIVALSQAQHKEAA